MTFDYKRLFLYALAFILGLQLWGQWQKAHQPAVTPPAPVSQTVAKHVASVSQANVPSLTPSTAPAASANTPAVATATVPASRVITVTTPQQIIRIDKLGGNIIGLRLPQYPTSLKTPDSPFVLMNNQPATRYIAQSGILRLQNGKSVASNILYTSSQQQVTVRGGDKSTNIVLRGRLADGLSVEKIYSVSPSDYTVGLTYRLTNTSNRAEQAHIYTQLSRVGVQQKHSMFTIFTYLGAAISSPEDTYEKISFKDMSASPLSRQIKGGWAAMIQHYFVSAWVPAEGQTSHYYSKATNNFYTIGFMSPALTLQPGQSKAYKTTLYSGPALTDQLSAVAKGLDRTVDYGHLWWICLPIFWLMSHLYSVFGNWGWSIVGVTIIIKACFYRLSASSYRSMAKMRKLQPKLKLLKERCGDDKQKFQAEMMKLYRKEKANPLGGCLPMIVQIPFFLGLYWVLIESVQLRHAPFIFWIQDLSVRDPYFVLPILMGLTMLLQQKMSPPPPDPTQAKMMMLLPVIFTVLFATFPAGLVLYWFVNNALSVLQQWYVTRKVEAEDAMKGARRKRA